MRKIVSAPADVLTIPAKKVTDFGPSLKKLISDMEKALIAQEDPKGVGLAAPQIGESLQIFLMKPNQRTKTKVIINPQIVNKSKTKAVWQNKSKKTKKASKTPLEGCLSVPRIWAPIKRAAEITIKYQDASGDEKKEIFKGFKSVIVQHEIDHLQGILFTQRALEQKSKVFEERAGKLKRIDQLD